MPLRNVVRRRGFLLGLVFVLSLYLLVGVIILVFGTRLLPSIGFATGLLTFVLAVYLLVKHRTSDA